MIVTCWSVKGGSGTSVVAAGLAAAWAADRPVLAVDLDGDLPAVLGLAAPTGPGVVDWLQAGRGVGAEALHALAVDAGAGLRVLHRGGAAGVASDGIGRDMPDDRWAAFAAAMAAAGRDVVIDAGLAPLPPELAVHSDASLLVIRPCFLALRRASAVPDVPLGAVVISEPGRALGRRATSSGCWGSRSPPRCASTRRSPVPSTPASSSPACPPRSPTSPRRSIAGPAVPRWPVAGRNPSGCRGSTPPRSRPARSPRSPAPRTRMGRPPGRRWRRDGDERGIADRRRRSVLGP